MHRLTIRDEQKALLELGITPTPGSGNTDQWKEDGQNGSCLVQRKATLNRQIAVKYQDLLDLIHHSEEVHKVPLFIFQVKDLQFICLPTFHIDKGLQVFTELQNFEEEYGKRG